MSPPPRTPTYFARGDTVSARPSWRFSARKPKAPRTAAPVPYRAGDPEHDLPVRLYDERLCTTRTLTALALTAAILAAPAPASADPGIGDAPPPLAVSEWVKGKPVDLLKELGKRVFMVEFWATWCPPCKMSVPRLTELQNKYEKDLTIIGVTAIDDRGNSRRAIRRFVKDQGDNMSYSVAIDEDSATWQSYMGLMAGIPHAFVVGREGKVVWQGSPLEPDLDRIIGEIVAGTYDAESAILAEKVAKRFDTMNFAVQMGHWSAVWDMAVGILQLDPANNLAMEYLLGLYVQGQRSHEAYRAWAESHIEKHRNNALVMQRITDCLCANPDIARRTPDLALQAGLAAYEASDRRAPEAIAAYARALYQIGRLDHAIRLQQEAVSAASSENRNELQGVLEYYETCKRLQSKVP